MKANRKTKETISVRLELSPKLHKMAKIAAVERSQGLAEWIISAITKAANG